MQSSTTCFSVKVILLRDSITFSRGPESVLTEAGDDWVEPELELEDGEGVSLMMGIKDASMVGLSVVMMLDTAISEGGKVARPKWE